MLDAKHANIQGVRVSGLVHPAVYAVPSSLYATIDRDQPPPTVDVRLAVIAPGPKLDVRATIEGSMLLDVKPAEPAGDGSASHRYRVTSSGRPSGTIHATLVFRTDNHESPEVRVPLIFRFADSGL